MNANKFEELYPLNLDGIKNARKIRDYYYIKPGEEVELEFTDKSAGFEKTHEKSYRLRLIGEVDLYYKWRGEGSFDLLYRLIDDALDSQITHHSLHSLALSSKGDDYARKAYYKIVDDEESLPKGDWRFGIWLKKENIKLLSGSNLKYCVEVYYKKEGVNIKDITGEPDIVETIELGDGTTEWIEKSMNLKIASPIGSILVYLIGENFSGKLWIEDPFLIAPKGYNQLPPFMPSSPYKRDLNWLGLNFSRKEWPEFEIKVNDKKIFEGELYQRIYRWPENEIVLPLGIIKEGMNNVSIKLVSHYREALSYKLRNIDLISVPCEDLNIVAYPEVASVGEEFSILVNTKSKNTEVAVMCADDKIVPIERKLIFSKSGLNVIKLKAVKAGNSSNIFIKTSLSEYCVCVERVVERQFDNVLTGTSDAVYINQSIDEMEQFLSWYMHHQIGNIMSFRPVYRWAGSRVLVPDVWKRMVDLCNRLGLYYSIMIDGRELPGCMANPNNELMKGKYYLGAQSHEQDGANYYWGSRPVPPEDELYFDIWSRSRDSYGLYPIQTNIRNEHGVFRFLDTYNATDMKQAANNFIKGVGRINGNSTRHTGPSVLFKYFYQAKVDWLGAELMYGPMEVITSALRGASKAYHRKDYGAHLAVQWASYPHDTPQRLRRYFLALYICYMQGISHINTEEGLWRIEAGYADFERFSYACTAHRKLQQKFYHFVQTHSRRGAFHTPFAMLHGNYDGWNCFVKVQVWMQNGSEWDFGAPEESWELLKVFYPLAELEFVSAEPNAKGPCGNYSGTPSGAVDIIPIETELELMKQYKMLAFLGWNTAEPSQIESLIEYVRGGGKLLLGWPHLYTCLKRSEALGDNPSVLANDIIKGLIGAEFNGFVETDSDTGIIKVGDIKLTGAKVEMQSKGGAPLIIKNIIGDGEVTFINVKAYPAEASVKEIYSEQLKRLSHYMVDVEKDKGWMNCPNEVGFTVYDDSSNNLRTIYIINMNWWTEEEMVSKASLLWEDMKAGVTINRGFMNIITLSDNWAVHTNDNDTDVVEIIEKENGAVIKLQGVGATEFTIFNKQKSNKTCKLISKNAAVKIEPSVESEFSWTVSMELGGVCELELQIVSL